MENRRPPRSNSSGRKPYFDRGQSAPSYRGGHPKGDGTGRGPRRYEPAGDGQARGRGARGPDPKQRDGRFGRNADNRFGPSRFGRPRPDRRNVPKSGKNQKPENEIKITSDDQVTDGKFRGRELLNSVSPNATRTQRKLREIVFKVLARRIKAGRILDLGAGSGTIGIEAISRGAMLATFVERSARMCTMIRKNLAEMGVKDGHGEVVEIEIMPFLKKAARRKRCWDIVYFDLPNGDEHAEILDLLGRGMALKPNGLLVVEHASDISHPDNISQLKRWRTLDHGERILSIYERI